MKMYAAAVGRRRRTTLPGDVQILLNSLGLRSTPRRIALATMLLKATMRRVAAEILYKEARRKGCTVSRAAVCNNLRRLEQAGFLKRITAPQSKKAWFVIANANAPHLFELNSGRRK